MASTVTDGRIKPALSKRARLHLFWLKIHRWIGLSLLAVFAMFAVTGSLLVWPDHADRLIHPGRYPRNPQAEPAAASTLLAAAKRALPPGDRVSAIRYPLGITAVMAAGQVNGPAPLHLGPPSRSIVWLEPSDGTVLAQVERGGGFQWSLRALHGHLLLAVGGREVVATVGIVLLISAVTGLWLWWPGLRNVGRALKWRKQASVSMNLHRQTGALIALVLIVEAATGTYVAVPALFARAIEPQSVAAEHAEGPPVSSTVAAPRQDIDRVLAQARALLPQSRTASIFLPTQDANRWVVNLTTAAGERVVEVADDTGAAALLPAPAPGPADRVERVMSDVHFGHYGTVWRTIVFISGVVLTLASVTGMLLWLQGRRRRTRNAAARQ